MVDYTIDQTVAYTEIKLFKFVRFILTSDIISIVITLFSILSVVNSLSNCPYIHKCEPVFAMCGLTFLFVRMMISICCYNLKFIIAIDNEHVDYIVIGSIFSTVLLGALYSTVLLIIGMYIVFNMILYINGEWQQYAKYSIVVNKNILYFVLCFSIIFANTFSNIYSNMHN